MDIASGFQPSNAFFALSSQIRQPARELVQLRGIHRETRRREIKDHVGDQFLLAEFIHQIAKFVKGLGFSQSTAHDQICWIEFGGALEVHIFPAQWQDSNLFLWRSFGGFLFRVLFVLRRALSRLGFRGSRYAWFGFFLSQRRWGANHGR